MMDEARFWSLIAAAWPADERGSAPPQRAISGALEDDAALYQAQQQMLAALTDTLKRLDADDLLAFDRILERKLYDIDRADIHEYTDGSDDGFLYCRGFIVSMGQQFYDLVRADPSRALMDFECGQLCYLPRWLYKEQFGPAPRSDISRETGSNSAGWA